MAFIEWRDSYNTCIPVIDQQHQGLVRLINKLHESIESSQDRADVGNVLRALVDYTICHFREEECLMAQHSPSLLEEHRAFHAAFEDFLSDHLLKWGMGEPVDSEELLEYLRWWLLDHIVCEDGRMAKAIMNHARPVAANP